MCEVCLCVRAETSGRPNHRRLLGFLNMCHGVVIAEPPDVKVKLADEMWSILRTKGTYVCVCGYVF